MRIDHGRLGGVKHAPARGAARRAALGRLQVPTAGPVPRHPCWPWHVRARVGYGAATQWGLTCRLEAAALHRLYKRLFKRLAAPPGAAALHLCPLHGEAHGGGLHARHRRQRSLDRCRGGGVGGEGAQAGDELPAGRRQLQVGRPGKSWAPEPWEHGCNASSSSSPAARPCAPPRPT